MARTAEVDVAKHFSHYTLDVIGEAGFGYKFNTVLCGDSPASQALQRIMTGRARLKTRVLKRMIPFIETLPLKANIETKKALKLTQSLVDEVGTFHILMFFWDGDREGRRQAIFSWVQSCHLGRKLMTLVITISSYILKQSKNIVSL